MKKQIPIKIAAFIILIICSVIAYAGLFKHQGQAPRIEGIFWQPDNNTTPPEGNWHYLGVNTFVPQWSVVESKSWWKESNFPQWEKAINFEKMAHVENPFGDGQAARRILDQIAKSYDLA